MTRNAMTNRSRRIDFLARHPAGDVITGKVIEIHKELMIFECEGTFWPIWKHEVSWQHHFEIADLVAAGDRLDILVTTSSPETDSGRFSLRRLKPNPYEEIFAAVQPGELIVGEIITISPKKGLRLHWGGGRVVVLREELLPCEVYTPGALLDVVVQETNPVARIAKASRLALFPDFYRSLVEGLQVGDVVEGTVANVTEFGVFVTIRPCLDGLVHVSTIAWLAVEVGVNERSDVVEVLKSKYPVGMHVHVMLVSIDISTQSTRVGIKIL